MFILYLPDIHDLTFWRLNFNKNIKMLNGNQTFFFFKERPRHVTGDYMDHGCQRNVMKSVSTPWKGAFPPTGKHVPPQAQPSLPRKWPLPLQECQCSPQDRDFLQSIWLLILHSTCPSVRSLTCSHVTSGSVLAHDPSELLYTPTAGWPSLDRRWTPKDEQSCSLIADS